MAKVKDIAMIFRVLCLCFLCMWVKGNNECIQLDNCRCQFEDDGSILDLTSVGNSDRTPRFKDVQSQDGYMYSYNPCKPFDEGDCKDAAACKKDGKSGQTLMAGHADTPEFIYDMDTTDIVIIYTAGSQGELHTVVYLLCDHSKDPGPPQIFANGTMDANLFVLTMYSACACGGRCDANGIIDNKKSTALSAGTYICISIIVVAFSYFVIGSLIMKFVKKASGKDIIPNSEFWFGLPVQVKNGCRFSMSKCGVAGNYSDV